MNKLQNNNSVNLSIEPTGAKLVGDLLFDSVMMVFDAGKKYIHQAEFPVFDFSEVSRIDSAGLALLLAWYRQANAANKRIQFRAVPKKLQSLLEVTATENILKNTFA